MLKQIDVEVDAFASGRITRRQLAVRLGTLVAGLAGAERVMAALQPGERPRKRSTFQAVELNHIALNVTDVPRSRDWYVRHLGLTVQRDGTQNCFLDCGKHFLALFRGRTPGLNHYCYTIKDYDAGRAVETLKDLDMKPRRTGGRVYFDDPDGIEVQVSAPNP